MNKNRLSTLLVIALGSLISLSFTYSIANNVNPTNGNDGKEDNDTLVSVDEAISNPLIYDTTGLYSDFWYNDRTFAYMERREKSFSDSTVVMLCDEIHDYEYPVKNKINSGFGYRRGGFHKGLDIALDRGDTVVAAFDGIVRYARYNNGGFGNLIIIRHYNGLETYYAHLNKMHVKANDTISAGQLIGLGGNTGARHSGPHLHFEVRIEDKPIDPSLIFDTETYNLKTSEIELKKDVFGPSRSSRSYDKNAKIYYVRKGDCLSTIARHHGTSVSSLCRLNGLSSTSVLQIGQKIRIK